MTILREPNVNGASKVRLPLNQTDVGHVTIAVTLSIIRLRAMGLIAGPEGANSTSSTTGDGIAPSCRTVTTVRVPLRLTFWIDPSTLSVANSQ